MFLSYHSYGHYILYSWGYGRIDAPDWRDLYTMGHVGAIEMKNANGGTMYRVGNAAKLLYNAAGKYQLK